MVPFPSLLNEKECLCVSSSIDDGICWHLRSVNAQRSDLDHQQCFEQLRYPCIPRDYKDVIMQTNSSIQIHYTQSLLKFIAGSLWPRKRWIEKSIWLSHKNCFWKPGSLTASFGGACSVQPELGVSAWGGATNCVSKVLKGWTYCLQLWWQGTSWSLSLFSLAPKELNACRTDLHWCFFKLCTRENAASSNRSAAINVTEALRMNTEKTRYLFMVDLYILWLI